MKLNSFFKIVQRFINSKPLVSFFSLLQRIVSFHWWIERSWKVKVQILIGLTAVLLLIFSLMAWRIYQCEYAKIANNFLRLQLFGPQEIFNPASNGEVKDSELNFCSFHLETRTPYGPILPNVQIKAALQTEKGVPFWSLSDETGNDGTFQLAIPEMQMPPRIKLVIHAEDGERCSDFTAFLKVHTVSKSGNTVPPSLSERSFSETDFVFEDSPLTSIPIPPTDGVSPFQPSVTIPNRLLKKPELPFSIFTPTWENHPVFLTVFQNGKLLACRPLIARGRNRSTILPLPDSVHGMFSVLLIDSAVSPPRVLQHELVYRLPPHDAELNTDLLTFLKPFGDRLNSPAFRKEKQNLEFLPLELANPSEMPECESLVLEEAADRLLGSVITPKVTVGPQIILPELISLERLLAHITLLTRSPASAEEPNDLQKNVQKLIEQTLKTQSLFLTQDLNSPQIQKIYAASLPIVFDSQSIQEEKFRNAVEKFRTNTKIRLGGMVCIILCSAVCLVVMMIMMTILGLPTDWRNWVLTFGIVLLALGLSYVISVQSDVDSSRESVRFAIFEGIQNN